VVLIFGGAALYFYFNPSYRLSWEAEYYFETGNYKKAYRLAHEAYLLDPYNRMAFKLEVQSNIAISWKRFINDADNYFKDIEKIAQKQNITPQDRLKVKIMLEILLGEYKTLKPSLLIPKKLKTEAKIRYEKAKKLYEELFEQGNSEIS
jgi:predicted transcriptional regulator